MVWKASEYHKSIRPVEFEPPPLGAILAYRSVWALCDLTKEKRLRATHYAVCLVTGRTPMWGVWTIHGVFQRFFTFKHDIADAYPKRVWRRIQSTWNLVDADDANDDTERRKALEGLYKVGVAVTGNEVERLVTSRRPAYPAKVVPIRAARAVRAARRR